MRRLLLLALLMVFVGALMVPSQVQAAPRALPAYRWLEELKKVISSYAFQEQAIRQLIKDQASNDDISNRCKGALTEYSKYEKAFDILVNQIKELEWSDNPYTGKRELEMVRRLGYAVVDLEVQEWNTAVNVRNVARTTGIIDDLTAAMENDDLYHAWGETVDAFNDAAIHWNVRRISQPR